MSPLSEHFIRAALTTLPRATKDFDLNLSRFDERLHKSFQAHRITPRLNPKRPTRFKGHPAPEPGRRDAVKIDSAVQTVTENFLRYTTKIDGITLATIQPRLAEKILGSTERPLMKGGKISILDDELLRYRLTQEVWRSFWERSAGFQNL